MLVPPDQTGRGLWAGAAGHRGGQGRTVEILETPSSLQQQPGLPSHALLSDAYQPVWGPAFPPAPEPSLAKLPCPGPCSCLPCMYLSLSLETTSNEDTRDFRQKAPNTCIVKISGKTIRIFSKFMPLGVPEMPHQQRENGKCY